MSEPGLPLNAPWPENADPAVVLVDAATKIESRMIERWVEATAPGKTEMIRIISSRRRHPGERTEPALAARLIRGDDPCVFAVRVAWLPPTRVGSRSAHWGDVLKWGDPRDPDPLRQRVIARRHPDRLRLIVGTPATASDLVAAHRDSGDVVPLTDFVALRAHRSLDREERRVRGNRYKVPVMVHQEILARSDFRDGVMRIAGETGMAPELGFARARYYLREIAASHSPFVIDLLANAIHWLYTQGYGAIVYDRDQLESIASLGHAHPIAFVPSHRSQLDRLSMQYLLWENDLPPNHTAAGINMNFFPIGPLIRRTGAFFIRRSFKEKPLYKFVLRSYLEYLIENRFALEWYMEGGRSRTGKLLPPRYGMLGWVVEAVERGKAEDVHLIPTSIVYDQIQDLAAYAAEAQGADKRRESLGWLLRSVRSLRRRYGNIHVRFGPPISVRSETGGEWPLPALAIEKLAFEVMHQIGRITPITPTAVISIALLWDAGRPATADEISRRATKIVGEITRRELPTTEPLHLDRPEESTRVLDQLHAHGSVSRTADRPPRYHLVGQQALQAAYYRNMVVHFFVPGAIAEISILSGVNHRERIEVALALRDLLKFEFFFSEREVFQTEIENEMTAIGDDPATWATSASLVRAHWAVLPFLDAYQVVADRLLAEGEVKDEKAFLRGCLEEGKTRLAAGELRSPDSLSQVLFSSGLELARHRGLLADPEGRQGFADELALARRMAEKTAGWA